MTQATAGAGGASGIEIKVDPSPLTPQHQKQMTTTSRSGADVSQGGGQEEVGGNHQEGHDDKDELSEVVSRLTAESEAAAAAAAAASGVGTGLTTD